VGFTPEVERVIAHVRDVLKNAPKPRPPTLEERAEAEARNARVWKLLRGDHAWKQLRGIAGTEHEIDVPKLAEIHELEPERLGPIEVIVLEDRRKAVNDRGALAGDPIEPDLSGRPMPKKGVLTALLLYAWSASIRDVVKETGFSYKLARRVWTWHKSGAVRYDLERKKFVHSPAYKLVSPKRDLFRLVRS
jgi:hypothetical protein